MVLPRWCELAISVVDRALYRVRAQGVDFIPRTGPAILLANHLSTVDPVLLRRALPRAPRFLAFEKFGAVETREKFEARLTRTLKNGELVCLFPEVSPSAFGQPHRFNVDLLAAALRAARASDAPIIPVGHDGIWGSAFSYSWRKYGVKKVRWTRLPISVHAGAPLPISRSADVMSVSIQLRGALLDLIAAAFADRPILRRHLGREVVKSLAGKPGRVAVIDRTGERREVSAARVFAAAAAVSRWLRREVPARRVGIVLPPGAGAVIANAAVLFAGKTPVNLNFTAGASTLRASFELGEVDTVITAKAMQEKLPDFPWPSRVIDLRATLDSLGKATLLTWLIGAWVWPSEWLSALLQIPRRGDREEAALLFTSGSAGAPKGVVLTHRNVLANCEQLTSTNVLPEAVTLLGCLPVFHSFGFTITIWYALLRRMRLVTIPSPLDTKRMIDAIRDERITCVVAAPTFLRPWLKKAQASDVRSLGLLVSGAEKMPLELHASFLETLQVEVMQGYGLTETTPVTNMNIEDDAFGGGQVGKRLGSVGRMLPGITARIVDPDTGEALPLNRTGMLLFRGENVFGGYLKDPEKTKVALRDGWFVTGDLARFDEDGFLFIEGRLSRFSKIGGEMVPHGTIEQKINSLFGFDQRDAVVLVVVGVPDASKGEALVVITTEALAAEEVREKLSEAGFANLWIPRVIKRVEKIPLLGTGKVDMQACKRIAVE
jgi:acyl-[acyl-carrier-protein]-phospholipid O-acyltransferase/long-chain-fatty-acid--[acyl-carrier-protein] ligase